MVQILGFEVPAPTTQGVQAFPVGPQEVPDPRSLVVALEVSPSALYDENEDIQVRGQAVVVKAAGHVTCSIFPGEVAGGECEILVVGVIDELAHGPHEQALLIA